MAGKKVKCVYYGCINETGDTKIKWVCIPYDTKIPDPPSSRCVQWTTLDTNSCDDCKSFVGELSDKDNAE
jgi:hypothetical protein